MPYIIFIFYAFNEPAGFLAQSRFFNGKGLSYFWRLLNSLLGLYLGAQTASPSRNCPSGFGIPENARAALPKTSIRCENRQIHLD
jgi:hypothetical protein